MRTRSLFVGLLLVLGMLAYTPGAYAGGVQTWQGQTGQGLPMDFMLVTSHGETVVHEWDFEFLLLCVKDGVLIDFGTGYSGFDVPVVDGKFSFTNDFFLPFDYFTWKGTINGDEAHGTAKEVSPGLTRKLNGEACTSGTPQWNATPSGAPAPTQHVIRIRVDVVKHPDGTISRTMTRSKD
jgi:hypothetical protein